MHAARRLDTIPPDRISLTSPGEGPADAARRLRALLVGGGP